MTLAFVLQVWESKELAHLVRLGIKHFDSVHRPRRQTQRKTTPHSWSMAQINWRSTADLLLDSLGVTGHGILIKLDFALLRELYRNVELSSTCSSRVIMSVTSAVESHLILRVMGRCSGRSETTTLARL